MVQRTYLRVELRSVDVFYPLLQVLESVLQLLVNVIHAGVFRLRVADEILQRGVLVEHKEFLADVGVVNRTQLQHSLYQRAGLDGVVGVHLLQGGIIARGQVSALQTIIAPHLYGVALFVVRLKFILASAHHHEYRQ